MIIYDYYDYDYYIYDYYDIIIKIKIIIIIINNEKALHSVRFPCSQ